MGGGGESAGELTLDFKDMGESRMMSEGAVRFDKITVLYVFRQTDQSNNVNPDQTPQKAASDLGLCCLPLTKQSYTHLHVVKLDLLKRSIR